MSTLQEDATAMLETIDSAEDGKKYERLSAGDRALIFQLHAKDVQQGEIARIIGCHPSTVCRTLKLIDTRQGARAILNGGAAEMATTVLKTKDAGIALKALAKLDVVRDDKAEDAGRPSVQVLIGIAPPGTPRNPMPLTARDPNDAA